MSPLKILIPLFSPSTGTWGGLTRVIAIAEAAQQAGHTVAFCASGYLENNLRERGYQVYATPPATFLGLPGSISRWIERRSQNVSIPVRPGQSIGSIWLVLMFSGMARGGYLSQVVRAEGQAARDFGADVLFTDLDPGAFILSRVAGLPVASAFQSVMRQGVGTFPWKQMNRAVSAVLREYHLKPQPADELFFGKDVLKIIPSIPALDGEDAHKPDVCYVGHLLGEVQPTRPGEFMPEPGKRYCFVYMGTGSVTLDVLREVLPAAIPAEGDLRAVVTAQSLTQTGRLGGVEFRPYVSAGAILPHCDWTICHGGQNTLVQSLLHGVPLIIFPGPVFERRFNAQRVQAAGAGVMAELPDFNVEWLQQVFAERGGYVQGAVDLQASLREYGGAPAAVKAIEERIQLRRTERPGPYR